MWLLHTETGDLEEFFESNAPPYAILSHTWMNEEITFVEMQNADENIRNKAGFKKIVKFCNLAKSHGYTYGWVDTCCIDKRSSAELSEAINSMYRYYYNAAECVIYLEDVPTRFRMSTEEHLSAITSSRWFTRCWTLQELLASNTRHFYARDWSVIEVPKDPNEVVASATGIDQQVLEDRDLLSTFPIAQRMRWASKRNATREEDIAYSLMGLFDVQMPIIYGEGATKAFRRLQTQIMQTSFDQTIFAWRSESASSGLLANSPANFSNTPQLALWHLKTLSPFHMTNVGLSIRLVILDEAKSSPFFSGSEAGGAPAPPHTLAALQCDCKFGNSWMVLLVHLEPIEDTTVFVNGESCKAYRRIKCSNFIHAQGKALDGWPTENIIVLEDDQYQLLMRAREENRKRWASKGV
jgi:Heterokaryon incompatibility protein (HET)